MANFTTSDGLNLYYTDEGDGLPILCLAGLTRTTADFDYVTPHLVGNRLIKLDYRGRGQSDFDSDWQNYALPVECRDVLELLAHLSLDKVAILGTSRGGLNAMGLAAGAKDRLLGIAMNDVGPVIEPEGIDAIRVYIGRNPAAKTHEEAAAAFPHIFTHFEGVPESRWLEEARKHYVQTDSGLKITYDPHLRDAVLAAMDQPSPDLWPFFDAMAGLPLALVWGANSNLLSAQTVEEMQKRRPDMILGEVPGRGHVPFLDEPQAVDALHKWIGQMQ
ncbi:Hydrolase or acyltransferase [Sulfitobacter noctilucicola]|uniref:Pimeloyl-ACP methyl ester carboxylesterase n=1 Tax=Sulfitobacter noctilucicola TaxID=1342301 RepID=A0A7W6Q3X6_9RHOB|nr:alpha/beta hydrolase [Sulfitobacter noctilucicola]KIN61919.1 Hydrolase or acyltransferase [Sulfitobacter noctilucicola]MBB4173559.1 pimeloyl-ACP methyl ester carboxylesterase [Sulfitobacter noctilucicola]